LWKAIENIRAMSKHQFLVFSLLLCAPFVAPAQVIQPNNVTLGPSQTEQFSVTSDQAIQWSILPSGLGSISPTGLYTAPASIGETSTVFVYAYPVGTTQGYMAQVTLGATLGTPSSMLLSPSSTSVVAGQSRQFTAEVNGTASQNVSWSVSPSIGSIANGLYTAPHFVSLVSIIKVLATTVVGTQTATATLLLLPGMTTVPGVSVSVSPSLVTVEEGQTQQFTAAVSGAANTAVTWSLSPQIGSVIDGTYFAPLTITAPQQLQVIATSVADPSESAAATVTLIPVGVSITPSSVALGTGSSASFSASVMGASNTAVAWSLNPAVGAVVNGMYTAPLSISSPQAITLTATSLADSTKSASATVNLTVNTPHFGKDGSELTAYVPGNSMFVRDMFFSLQNNFPQYVSAFNAAGVNTLESGFYPPTAGYSGSQNDMLAWQASLTGSVNAANIAAAINAGFKIILTGDDLARGSDAVYANTRGPAMSWSVNPISYAFTWAKNLPGVLGIAMVDEITSQFAAPFPQGLLGAAGGPQTITCVNDFCNVDWPSPYYIGNGAQTFLISGATSNPNLNRPVTNLYTMVGSTWGPRDWQGFNFTSTGVGTQTFTPATDPSLTFQMFAAAPEGPSGTDYVHNDAIQDIMANINAVPGGPPNISWPAAALAPPQNFAAWAGDPRAGDYADLYFTFFGSANPSSYAMSDGLSAFNAAWNAKAPVAQPNKPILLEASNVGLGYSIVGTPMSVASFDGVNLQFAEPHGVEAAIVGVTRLNFSGSPNAGFDGNYYVYNVVDAYTLQVYKANPSGPTVSGNITVSFSDGQSVSLTFPNSANLNGTGVSFTGAPYCVSLDNFGQIATISGTSYPPYNGRWFVYPFADQGFSGSSSCNWYVHLAPLLTGQPATGGTASLIADNYYHAGVSPVTSPGVTADLVAANIAYAAEQGAAGARVYMFGGGDSNHNAQLNGCFDSCSTQVNADPFYNGPDAQAIWQGMSNAFNFIGQIEPYLLQPQLPSPSYTPTIITAARTSAYGNLLLMTDFADAPELITIDLSPYNTFGGTGTMYLVNGEQFTQQKISGTSLQVTFTPGLTVGFTFSTGN
jgi:hypothetical protein